MSDGPRQLGYRSDRLVKGRLLTRQIDPAATDLPAAFEEDVAAALDRAEIEISDPQGWQTVHARVDPRLDGKLMAFVLRMATLATRTKDPRYIRAAALASVLGGDIDYDWRDVLIVISAVNDAANRIGADAEAVIRSAALLATPHRSDTILRGFLRREEIMKEPDTFGIEVVETPGGVLYNFPRPRKW